MSTQSNLIIFGLRHKRLFGIINQLGEIIDALTPLQGEGLFPLECFSKVGWTRDRSSITVGDDEATFYVDVDTDGFVFTCDLEAIPKINIKEAYNIFIEISKTIFSITKADNTLGRLGIVENYRLKAFKNAAKVIANDLLKLGFNEIADFCSLRLTLKDTTKIGLIKGDRHDYKNIIMQISSKKSERKSEIPPDEIVLSLDYQHYFVPDVKFSAKHLEDHFKFFQNQSKELREGKLSVLFQSVEVK